MFDEKFINNVGPVVLYWSQAPQEEDSPGGGVEGQQPGQQEEELLGESEAPVDQPVGQPPPPLSHRVALKSPTMRELRKLRSL